MSFGPYKMLGDMLKGTRLGAGLTQAEVAAGLPTFVTAGDISDWERGVTTPPVGALSILASMLELEPLWLVEMYIEAKRMGMRFAKTDVDLAAAIKRRLSAETIDQALRASNNPKETSYAPPTNLTARRDPSSEPGSNAVKRRNASTAAARAQGHLRNALR